MVLAELFVCKVLTTRCPVIDALTAISAVSWSRISPIMMISGSCRKIERRALLNVSPAFSFTCTWLTPFKLASTGSSTVIILTPSTFNSLRAVYNVVDFPLPVGPVTRIRPLGWLNIRLNLSNSSSGNPRSRLSMVRAFFWAIRITTFSP